MAATEANPNGTDAHEEIRQLRAQVEALMRDRVTPALSNAAGHAEDTARRMSSLAHDQTEVVTKKVQEWPLTSVLVAAAAGYVIGRLTR